MKAAFILALGSVVIPLPSPAQTVPPLIEVSPHSVAVERPGITGAGWAVVAGDAAARRVILTYPNHPDDFGGSTGTGTAFSEDGGHTWTAGPDDWPIEKTADLWMDRLRDGTLVAFGIRWLPDPAKRGEQTAADVPEDAFALATSADQGRTWDTINAALSYPKELGIVARPLPHLFEDEDGAWLMPAYAWAKTGNRALLLRSADRGRSWSYVSTIANSLEVAKSGTPVTTPWLETAVTPTADGGLLAVMRTGSNEQAALIGTRSADGGKTWSPAKKVTAGPDQREPAPPRFPGRLRPSHGLVPAMTRHPTFSPSFP